MFVVWLRSITQNNAEINLWIDFDYRALDWYACVLVAITLTNPEEEETRRVNERVTIS